MSELINCFKENGIESIGVNATATQLHEALALHPNCRGVALVNGNHWVAVSIVGRSTIAMFDYPQWLVLDLGDFDGIYNGKVLFAGETSEIVHIGSAAGVSDAVLAALSVLTLCMLGLEFALTYSRNVHRKSVTNAWRIIETK